MKKTLIRGICQTLILVIALFLASVQILQFMNLAADLVNSEAITDISQEEKQMITQVSEKMLDQSSTRDQLIYMINDNPGLSASLFTVMFLLIGLFLLPDMLPWDKCPRRDRIRILVNAALYIACGIPFIFLRDFNAAVEIMNFLYAAILIGESVIKLRKKHTPVRIVWRILLIVLTLLNLYALRVFPYFVLAVIIARCIKQIMIISFSQIRMDVLNRIIRKTYASEILLGMILLMIAFSMLLSIIEPGMPEFFDALWYCFAIVTTIGFGDVSAVTVPGRLLSMILGIYGIIVVALITSIIVNFYNEMKSENKEQQET